MLRSKKSVNIGEDTSARRQRPNASLMRFFIEMYEKDRLEALDAGDVRYVRFCEEKLTRYRTELPQLVLMEKLESDL